MHQSLKDGSKIQKYTMNDAQMDHNPNMHQTSRNASKSKNASKFEEMVQKRFKIKLMHKNSKKWFIKDSKCIKLVQTCTKTLFRPIIHFAPV